MPIYIYRRSDGRLFEYRQKITDEPLTRCPKTGEPVERVIAQTLPPVFKGSGFYETDCK